MCAESSTNTQKSLKGQKQTETDSCYQSPSRFSDTAAGGLLIDRVKKYVSPNKIILFLFCENLNNDKKIRNRFNLFELFKILCLFVWISLILKYKGPLIMVGEERWKGKSSLS